jgi:Tol biopolymer transport system component
MRFFPVALLALAAPAMAGCPYAEKLAARGDVASMDAPHAAHSARGQAAAPGKKGVMFMNRIGPSSSELYIANADGSNETKLFSNGSATFDYHASFSPDGQWIVFTSERRADGQADLYRVRVDGTGLESLVSTSSLEDAGALSPDGTKLAYVSTANGYVTNIWVMDLATKTSYNLTDTPQTVGNADSPDGHFRPSWSPDGQWIAFSSDRNTDWTGHSNGTGWEHTQELSIYVIRPNGSDFRQLVTKSGYSLGTPKWSADGSRVLFNEMTREATYDAHRPEDANTTQSQIVSVDFATGTDRIEHTSGGYVKIAAQWMGNSSNVGYLIKAGPNEGVNYTAPDTSHQAFSSTLRNPSWSPDGTKIVYEKTGWDIRPAEKVLESWDSEWEYRFMDVFPQLNNKTGKMVFTQKQLDNSSAIVSNPDYTDLVDAFNIYNVGASSEESLVAQGLAGAFQPTMSPDGEQIIVGFGAWFFARAEYTGTLYMSSANGTGTYENLTDGTLNAGFPSYSPDGSKIVYRLWDLDNGPLGLRIMDLNTREVTNLTWGWDNTPGWSPDGERIVFTRNTNWTVEYGSRWYADRFDVCTIRPDGTDLQVLTTSGANDAHAVWSADGRIMYNSGMYGFRDECAIYDDTFQPYGQIVIMNADGSNKTMLTDSLWEDSMPLYVPNSFFETE